MHNRLCFCLCAYDGIKWMNFDCTKFGMQHIIFLLQHGILLQKKCPWLNEKKAGTLQLCKCWFKFKVAGQAIFPIKLTWKVKILTFCFWINSKQKELKLFGHLTMEVNFINFYIHVFTFISNIHGDIKDSKVGSIQDGISCNHGFLFRWPECYS